MLRINRLRVEINTVKGVYGIDKAFEVRQNQEFYRRPPLSNPEAQHSGILGIDR